MTMTMSLAALCAAAAAAVAFVVSVIAGAAAAGCQRALQELAPAAQARVWLAISLLPAFACLAVMTAALAPSFGWIGDHCAPHGDPHAHPHICADHHVADLPGLPVIALAMLLLGRVAVAVVRLVWTAAAAASARRALERIACASPDASLSTSLIDGARVLPFDEPQAFVVGLTRPALFVTRGLLSEVHREHLEPVLAHEHAHLLRRDALRRWLASLALAFHVPPVATWLERRLARAHEMAADAEAAAAVHSRRRVARALVQLTRARKRALAIGPGIGPTIGPDIGPTIGLAFGSSDVEARVACLLDPRLRQDRPQPRTIVAVAAAAIVLVGAGAGVVHHGVEIMLGLLSS